MSPPNRFVSTGALPSADRIAELVTSAHARFSSVDDGECSAVYPALAAADPNLFAISVAGVGGNVWQAGDVAAEFTLMSVSKPFVLALVGEVIGDEQVRRLIGINATGLPFNSLEAVDRSPDGRTNPMVNSGAISTSALVPGSTVDERWEWLLDGLSRFAGRRLALDNEVYTSAAATNHRNRAIANLLHSRGVLAVDPDEAVELYTRQCSISVDTGDLAVLAATIASSGINPRTGERVVSEFVCHNVMAVMTTAGMYDTSGDWLWDVGMPGKSGISGAILTVSPGKGGLGVFSPPLDPIGNSVRGQLVATFLSAELGLDMFAS